MEPLRPTRRTLTRTAAWTVPVVAVATAAPAFAASPCNCPEFYFEPFPTSGTMGNNWTISIVSGTRTNPAQSTFEGVGTNGTVGQFNPADDPTALTTLVVQAARTICVTNGQNYRIQYDYTMYTANAYTQTAVLKLNNINIPGTNLSSEQAQTTGSIDVTWKATVTGNVTMAFVHTTVAGALAYGDEIKIKNVRGSCS